MANFLQNAKSIIREFSPILGNFSQHEILVVKNFPKLVKIPLIIDDTINTFIPNMMITWYLLMILSSECAVDSEWNDVSDFIVACSVVELFVEITKNPPPNTTQNIEVGKG